MACCRVNFTFTYKEDKGCPVKCQAGTEVGRGMAVPKLDPGPRRERVASVTPRPLYLRERDQVSIVQEVGWASAPCWMGLGYLARIGVRSTGPSSP